ncbi:MAG: hypothetical protein HKN79_00040, partial [Flavobacteriales bacterium]|nr:hypothetical protein [Flavobacteriales bacterium]
MSMTNETYDVALHRAAQYLATFGKNFCESKEDDSHTNLEWVVGDHLLRSREAPGGRQLILNGEELALQWVGDRPLQLTLAGRTHGEVIVWMHHAAVQNGLSDYEFHLHYRLPSGPIPHDYVYPRPDAQRAEQVCSYRDNAQ